MLAQEASVFTRVVHVLHEEDGQDADDRRYRTELRRHTAAPGDQRIYHRDRFGHMTKLDGPGSPPSWGRPAPAVRTGETRLERQRVGAGSSAQLNSKQLSSSGVSGALKQEPPAGRPSAAADKQIGMGARMGRADPVRPLSLISSRQPSAVAMTVRVAASACPSPRWDSGRRAATCSSSGEAPLRCTLCSSSLYLCMLKRALLQNQHAQQSNFEGASMALSPRPVAA